MTKRMRTICFCINMADSRKNGFGHQEENDTEHPYWIFSIPDFRSKCIHSGGRHHHEVEMELKAVNCEKCGGYHYSEKIECIPLKILCTCFYTNQS